MMIALVKSCQTIGRKIPFWTQGAGGNVSVKEGKSLFIKASGVRLGHVRHDRGIAEVYLAAVTDRLEKISGNDQRSEQLYAEALQAKGAEKPSMETGMHVFLPQKWVFHFHALPALLMAHEFGKEPNRLKTWLNTHSQFPVEFIEPIRPGLLLSRRIKENTSAAFYILENHGVLIQGETDAIVGAWTKLETDFCHEWNYDLLLQSNLPTGPAPLRLYFPDSAVFLTRLKGILEKVSVVKGEPFYSLKKGAMSTDPDVSEVWQATEALFAVCPDLKELPNEISSVVANLPTEIFRQSRT